MGNFKDITLQVFGKLTAIKPLKIEGKGAMHWQCLCECGNKTIICGTTLREGRSKSCGCNTNQSALLKFKKENPTASYRDLMKLRIQSHSKNEGRCRVWTATKNKQGYGVFVLNGKTVNASRAAWIAEYGEIPKGLCVCHACDNASCVDVKHLFLGSHKINSHDMKIKGRDNWASCRKFPLGTRQKIWDLRQQGKKYIDIANELNMSIDQIKSQLQNHKRHLRKSST